MVDGSSAGPSVRRRDRHGRADPPEQDVVHRKVERLRIQAEREGEARLRIKIDQQHPAPELGERDPRLATVVVLATPPF